MWRLPWGLTSLPMMVKSSQPQETKREKCKCKCREGPGGQGIADPFDDLTKEIGSRNVREQAPCVQKNQNINHQSWITVTWKSLCFAPTCLRVARSNLGLGTLFPVTTACRNPLGEKGNQSHGRLLSSEHPATVRSGPAAWWTPSRSPTTVGPLAPRRTRMRDRRSRFCFILLSSDSRPPSHSLPAHPHCGSAYFTLTATGKTTNSVGVVIWCEKVIQFSFGPCPPKAVHCVQV